jgi:hypothetical protein
MTETFEPHTDEEITANTAAVMSQTYGDVSVNGNAITFHSSPRPSDEEIAATRADVIRAMNGDVIKQECRRRIYAVTKDDITQTNINAYLSDTLGRNYYGGGGTPVTPPQEDVDGAQMAGAIHDWVNQMRAKSRELVEAQDPTYANDSHWPLPPDGAADFVANF